VLRDSVGNRVMTVAIVITVGHRCLFACNGVFGSILIF